MGYHLRKKLSLILISCHTLLTSKRYLNVKVGTIKLLKGKRGEFPHNFSMVKAFLKFRSPKEKINKFNYVNIKICITQTSVKEKSEDKQQNGENIYMQLNFFSNN